MKSRSKSSRKNSAASGKTRTSARKKKSPKKRSSKPVTSKAKKRRKTKRATVGAARSPAIRVRARTIAFQSAAVPVADLPGMTCSNGWYITGYYTPLESDYQGNPEQISVTGKGPDSFPADFLSDVRMEGWGQTRYGWFLGFYSAHYSFANAPQSAIGKPLKLGSLAVDKNEIPFGSTVRIPALPTPWNNQLFVADDVGEMINQKHVDVYCGIGASARAQTMQVTGNNRRLCQK